MRIGTTSCIWHDYMLPNVQRLAPLVDDVELLLSPVIVGGGTPALPSGLRVDLELVDERRFANGVVHLHHRVVQS